MRDTQPGDLDTRIRVTREIPLWGLVTAGALIVGQGITFWNGQQKQGEKIDRLTDAVEKLSAQMVQTRIDRVEATYQITDLQRRVSAIEKARP